jgi:hypothetical protein
MDNLAVSSDSEQEMTADEILKLKQEKMAQIEKIKNDIKLSKSGFIKKAGIGFTFPGVSISPIVPDLTQKIE